MKVYDLEHHCYSKEMLEQLYERTEPPYCRENGVIAYNKYMICNYGKILNLVDSDNASLYKGLIDLDGYRIAKMDKAGVDVAVISTSSLIEDLPREESIKCARITNDAIAAACKTYPDRFLGTIALPMPFVDDAIEELERAKKLGLKYVHTHSSWTGGRLSDDKYLPIIAKCAELGLPIYIHPASPQDEYFNRDGTALAGAGFGFGVDVMKTVDLLVLKGVFDQYPKFRIILGHMGEFLPYLVERMDNRFFAVPSPEIKCKHKFDYYIRNKNIMMTTSGITDSDVAMFVIKKYGVENIVFGSDYPYENFKEAVDFIKNLPISDEDKEKIFFKNAEKNLL